MEKITKNLTFKEYTWGELKRVVESVGAKDDTKIHLVEISSDSKLDAIAQLDDNELFITNYPDM